MSGVVIACPFPFPSHEATTRITVYQEQETEDQGPIETIIYDGLAIYDEKSKIVYGKDSKQISQRYAYHTRRCSGLGGQDSFPGLCTDRHGTKTDIRCPKAKAARCYLQHRD